MKFSLLTVFFCVYVQSVTSLYCYWNTGCPYNFFSSKTPYNAVRGDIRDSVVKLTGKFIYCDLFKIYFRIPVEFLDL